MNAAEKVNILLVDDQHSRLLSYEAILLELGERLVTARSGSEALKRLMEEEFAGLNIPLFVTIGSPLGVDEVQDFIRDLTKKKKLTVPPNVQRWINVCDPLDPVALDKDISGDYGANLRGARIENHIAFNPDSPRHPHSATGYLTLEEVRQPIREIVDTSLFQPVARFKMAKDVVRALADGGSGERHRILVQLEDYATNAITRANPISPSASAGSIWPLILAS